MASDEAGIGYAKDMYRVGRGHALLDPHPGYQDRQGVRCMKPAVDIGDVGYVLRGSFHLLFNIHRNADDPRQINGTPPNFYPVERTDPRLWPIDIRGGMLPDPPRREFVESFKGVVAEFKAGVEVAGVGMGSSGFTYKHKRGATLTYFDRRDQYFAENTKFYRTYFEQNVSTWSVFLQKRNYSITEEDLIFVTGYDRVRAWATAWRKSWIGGVSLGLKVQPVVVPNTSIELTGSLGWERSPHVAALSGPPPDELTSQLATSSSADHCIFVTGFRIKRNNEVIKAGAGPHTLPTPDGGAGAPPRVESFPVPSASEDNSLLAYALKFIMDYYKPSCPNGVLTMHDNDLKPYLPGPNEDVPWDSLQDAQSYLSRRLRESPPDIIRRTATGWEKRVANGTHGKSGSASTADVLSDPGYDENIDYVSKLHNYLGLTKQRDVFSWGFTAEGPAEFPKHNATALLNTQAIGQGMARTKSTAKKIAAFSALKYLGQV